MQSYDPGLIRRRSSSLSFNSVTQRPDGDDVSIARELLLAAPRLSLPPRRTNHTSNTWTSSDADVPSDRDQNEDRSIYVHEYNRLAKKHGVRAIHVEEDESTDDFNTAKPGWFRRILRRTSSTQSVKGKPEQRHMKHRRSISDLSLKLKMRKDKLKDKDIQELVRLCGASILYLPSEYATGSLSVPTCFRATAQFLAQYGTSTRGIFRIPGSHSVVAALYNYYCSTDEYGMIIADTVRCPTLPEHIRCDVHDVASAFKKFLSGLPGGILGSLALLDALISIQSQLAGQAEVTRTKQSKVRARLIALAVSTLRSQSRRELICAVFGLLCMIGRAAEITRREDDHGRPLPTSDLMGYSSLGIVFGPLLVGDLLEDYTMRLANPHGGLVLLPVSPPKSRKERQKKTKSGEEGSAFNTHVDKIKVANGITEMLITHWRDVVRHLKNLNTLRNSTSTKSLATRETKAPVLRPSASESFALRKPLDWGDYLVPPTRRERSESPTPPQRPVIHSHASVPKYPVDSLTVRKQRNAPRRMSNQRLSTSRSLNILSPTLEEDTSINPDLLTVTPRLRRRRLELDGSAYEPEDNDMPSSGAVRFAAVSKSPRGRAEVAPNEQNSILQTPLAVEDPVRSTSSLASVENAQNTNPKTPRSNTRSSVLEEVSQNYVERSVQFTSPKTTRSSPSMSALGPLKTSTNSIGNDKFREESAVTMKSEEVFYEGAKEVRRPAARSTQIKLPAESPKNWNNGGQIALRRFGGSEPDLKPKSTTNFNRRISKSLYEDPKRKRNLMDWSQIPATKDPLMRVSQAEDSRSLAALSRALDIPEKKKSTGKLRKLKRSLTKEESPVEKNLDKPKRTPAQSSSRGEDIIRKSKPLVVQQRSLPENAESSERARQERSHNISTQDGTGMRVPERVGQLTKQTILPEPKLTDHLEIKSKPGTPSAVQTNSNGGISGNIRPPTTMIRAARTHSSSSQTNGEVKAESVLRSTLAGSPPKRSLLSGPVVTPTGSPRAAYMSRQIPGSPNKIAALVAKFNASNAIRPYPVPKLSPSSTPSRERDTKVAKRDRKETLLGPYRTNSPSPTKSQKSAKSIKSTKSDWTSQSGRGSPLRSVTPIPTTVSNHSLEKNPISVQEPHLHVSLNVEWRDPENTSVPTPESTPKPLVLVSLNNLAPQRSQLEDLADAGSLQRATSGKYSGSPQSYQTSVGLGDGSPVADSPLQTRVKAQHSGQPRWFPTGIAMKTSVSKQTPPTIESQGVILVGEFSGKPSSLDTSKRTQTESVPVKDTSPNINVDKRPGFECDQCSPRDSSKPPSDSRYSWPVPAVESRMVISNLDGPGSIGSVGTSGNERRHSPTGSIGSLGITGNESVYSPGGTKTSIPLTLRSFPVSRQPFPPASMLFPGAEDFAHPESPFADLLLPPSLTPVSPSSSGRITPVQDLIQDLRMSLTAKTEEIKQLRQQLEEGLNAAKKEAEGWKKRALAAERRLEVYEGPALPPRSSSKAGSSQKSYTSNTIAGSTGEQQAILDRGRDNLRGGNIDGVGTCHSFTQSLPDDNKETIAQVSECWSSEESTDTVIRDTNSNVWSTDAPVSIAQVEKELEEAGAF